MTTPNYPDSNSGSPYGADPSNGQGSAFWQDSTYGQNTPSYSQHPGYGSQGAAAFPGSHGATRPGPPSNIGWAVASLLFFWPLSFVAMTRASDVYPLWAAGHHAEAEAASASAKKLGLISLAIFGGLVVLYFVFIIAMVGLTASGF
ncbi:MAG: CD225/dispanin family protein [Dietzia sp.]